MQAKRKWPQSLTPSILADEPELRADILKYGEMVQSVYDTLFTKDTQSSFFGRCRKDAIIPGEKLGKYADQPGGVIVLQPDSKAREYTVRGPWRGLVRGGRELLAQRSLALSCQHLFFLSAQVASWWCASTTCMHTRARRF